MSIRILQGVAIVIIIPATYENKFKYWMQIVASLLLNRINFLRNQETNVLQTERSEMQSIREHH